VSSSQQTALTTRSTRDLPTELPPNAGRVATGVAIVLVAQLMLVLDATVVNVALPRIDTDLGFGPASLSWVLNAYTLAFGGLLLLGGRLGDVRGRLRMFEIGLTMFTMFSLLGGLAQTPTQLVLARALQGAGAAMAAPSVLALLTTSAPDEAARNRALALFGAVSSAGASIGLLLGGVVTDLGSWRWTLFINVPIGIAVLVAARRFVTET
jgi:MFS family permease